MCGISGFNFKDEILAKKMNDSLAHRGPDGEGIFSSGDFTLCHRRLSIIDLSEKASQPMFNEDKTLVVVFNGEIYNFKEIKKSLIANGHKFISSSDTEVLVHGFEEYGEKLPELLNGIFAFAVWNAKNKELFLCRDRIGVKPIYYYHNEQDGKFIFSSEIKAILNHPIERRVNKDSLAFYFRLHYIPQPQTILKNIYKVPPASFLRLKDEKFSIKKYWDIKPTALLTDKKEIKGKILKLLEDSVKSQLVSDRPLGVFLSGGVDSSAILHFASKHTNYPVKTFSVGFETNDQKNKFNVDFELARKTARFFNADHNELFISGKNALDNIEKVIWQMDEPVSNPTQAATFLLSRFASEKVKVVLGGDGGDEVFGGYDRHRLSRIISLYQKIPALLRFAGSPIAGLFSKSMMKKLVLPPDARRYLSFMVEENESMAKIINKDFLGEEKALENYFNGYFFNSGKFGEDFENTFMEADLKAWLADESLMRSDKMTMAWGLEERVPLLDHKIIELGFQIPSRYKLSFKNTKIIYKEALKPYLPEYLFNQPKRGWFTPMAKWLRTDFKNFAYSVLSEGYCHQTREFFNFDEIGKVLDDHINKKKYNLNLIWSLITFQIWYKRYMC